MEILLSDIEKVANKILLILKENSLKNSKFGNEMIPEQEVIGTICHLYKHYKTASSDRWAGSLRYDVIRMLIRGFDCSHSLCLHVCNESSEFHIYSKKGWISFCPDKDALLVTIGDQMQVNLVSLLKNHELSHIYLFHAIQYWSKVGNYFNKYTKRNIKYRKIIFGFLKAQKKMLKKINFSYLDVQWKTLKEIREIYIFSNYLIFISKN